MSRQADTLIGLIADDFTGALDAGVEFVRAGLETLLTLTPGAGRSAAVRAINTDSRDTDAATARWRTAQATQQLARRRIFKKIDSTLRGHVGAEIDAILDSAALEKALVCPAAIEAGRTVRGGQLFVNGALLHTTDFRHDPFWPARTSELAELIGRPTTHLALDVVRSGGLASAIAGAPTRIVSADASTHADLAAIAEALGPGVLPCGALGLARAWAQRFGIAAPAMLAPAVGRGDTVLVVAGSRHPATAAQLKRLLVERALAPIEIVAAGEGWRGHEALDSLMGALSAHRSAVVRAPAELRAGAAAQRALVEALGELAARVCADVVLGGMVVVGGETASAICQRLGAEAIHIRGEVEVGMPWSTIAGGHAAGLPIVTKAGGFGTADALVKAVDMLQGRPAA